MRSTKFDNNAHAQIIPPKNQNKIINHSIITLEAIAMLLALLLLSVELVVDEEFATFVFVELLSIMYCLN